jgi:hypothetical protein
MASFLGKAAGAFGGLSDLAKKTLTPTPVEKPVEKVPLWLYRSLAAFPVTGLLGLDHLALGSVETTVAKLLVNLITLGSWYVYDMMYSINGEDVMNVGLKVPFLETVSVKPGGIDLESELTDKTKLFLYGLLTLMSGLICGIAYLFKSNQIANIFMIIAGSTTLAIGGYTAYQTRSLVMKTMLSGLPGGALLSKIPMMGGGEKKEGLDFVLLSTLFILSITGFALSAIRSKSQIV